MAFRQSLEKNGRASEVRQWPIIAASAAIALFAMSAAVMPISNNDVWLHLTTGRLILLEGEVPTIDRYTFPTAGVRYVAHGWLAAVSYAVAEKVGGESAVIVVGKVIPVFAILAILGVAIRTFGASWGLAIPGVLLAVAVVHRRILVRPELLAIPILLGSLCLLMRDREAARAGRRSWEIAWLIPIQIVWVNIHGSHVLGLVLIAAFVCAELAERLLQPRDHRANLVRGLGVIGGFGLAGVVANLAPSAFALPAAGAIAVVAGLFAFDGWRPIIQVDSGLGESNVLRLAAIWLAVAIAGLANPLGPEIYLFPFEFSAGQNLITDSVNEWRPLLAADHLQNSLTLPAWTIYSALGSAALSAAIWKKQLRVLEIALLLIFVLLPLRHVRWLGMSALALAPVLAAMLTRARGPTAPCESDRRPLAIVFASAALAAIGLAFSQMLFSKPDIWFRIAWLSLAGPAVLTAVALARPKISNLGVGLTAAAGAFALVLIAGSVGYPEKATSPMPPWVGSDRASFGPSRAARGATEFLKNKGISGRLFTRYEWAPYVVHRNWPEITVFIDSRSDVHGESLLAQYRRMKNNLQSAREGIEEHNVDLLLYRPAHVGPRHSNAGLIQLGRSDPSWQLLYIDDESVLLGRTLAGRDLPAPLAKSALLEFEIGTRHDDAEILEQQARRALERAPDSSFLGLVLADSLRLQRRPEEALVVLERVWSANSSAGISALLAGKVASSMGRADEARVWFARAQATAPEWPAPRRALEHLDQSER
jgi:hypothetical protein